MLEYTQNGYGQQNYAVHEDSYAYEESWGSEDEHHGHGHHGRAQAQMMSYPTNNHAYGHGHAPNLNKHQSMSHGSETKYHDHGYGSEKMHHGAAGWNGPNTSSAYYSMPTNGHMGAQVPNFQGPMAAQPSMYGVKYPAGNMVMEASEHDVHYQVNAPTHMKPQGLKHHASARPSSNGGYRHAYDDGYGYQSVEWESRAL